ncbi:hybrid sensor histidine kinase/response regulator [Desulfosoma caldarium]|uniref:histidine kinase n=1 Tax=Desulfosoma caldarium TaxID=610254 RepID=A0A3N1VL62_9BACT|nr:ATP-binding protein [Desulfosoma caldarium]ROR01691.1 signal transduction histidine kinase [Desulfosoma caldarium]
MEKSNTSEKSLLFQEIFNHVATGIAVYEAVDDGADFIFKDINPAGAAIGKIPREAHLGRRVTEVYPGVEGMGLLAVFRKVYRTGVPAKHPVTQYADERLSLWVENYVARLPSGDILVVFNDLTEQKRAASEKAELLKQIHHMQKMEALAALAAGIGHDFNNLLMPILGYAQMGMSQGTPSDLTFRYFQRIHDAARRAKDLVAQILLISREQDSVETTTDFVPILKECVKLLRAGMPKSIDVTYSKLPESAPTRANPTEAYQILMNLAVNAYHAVRSTKGTVTLELECPCRDARFLKRVPSEFASWVRLSVLDTGPGVPPELREKIFDPYFTTKSPEEGTGLGLFIVSGVVQRLGGTVWVDDAPWGGAAFHVLLPAASAQAVTSIEEVCEGPMQSLDVRVLAVDDDADVRQLLETYLKSVVSRLTVCETPQKAMHLFQQNPEGFDVVLTDYSMPQWTGLDVARSVKTVRPSTPVVMLTGYRTFAELKDLETSVVDRVVYKPVTRSDLLNVLKEVVKAS